MAETDTSTGYTRIPHADFNTMRLRLDTEPELDKIKVYLTGEKSEWVEDEKGNVSLKVTRIGMRKAGVDGIASIMNKLGSLFNPHIVQGNFPVDNHGYSQTYENFLYFLRLNLTQDLMQNIYEYEIYDSNYNPIIDYVMDMLRAYLTRLIGNEERINYTHTLQSQERNVINQEKPKLFGLLG